MLLRYVQAQHPAWVRQRFRSAALLPSPLLLGVGDVSFGLPNSSSTDFTNSGLERSEERRVGKEC